MSAFRIQTAQTNLLGAGAVGLLPDMIRRIGFKRALIVTDSFLYRSGVVARVALALESAGAGFGVYEKVQPNPTVEIVEDCLRYARGIGADCLVAVGGGSPIDTAKAVGILFTNAGTVQQYEGINRSRKAALPIIAINTTAGTGSEVTSFYIVTNPQTRSKMCMVDENCIPIIAVNDSELMMSMPAALTAATGMDALTHAIEAYLSRNANPVTDKDALWAIRTISRYLPDAVADGSNRIAREQMAYAANAAGVAFSNAGLGMVHAMAHALGGFYNLPHGICNAVLLPYAMAFNSAAPMVQLRMVQLAEALGAADTTGLSLPAGAQKAVEAVRGLSAALGTLPRLSQLEGVNPDDFGSLAQLAMKDTCMAQNPILPTTEQVVALYKTAYAS